MGPKGEFPQGSRDTSDDVDEMDDEEEYVPAKGPLGGLTTLESVEVCLEPRPAGKVVAMPSNRKIFYMC